MNTAKQSQTERKSAIVPNLQDRIFTIRRKKVILDSDMAEIYRVETKRLNEQVRRNAERFPSDFAFILTAQEAANLKSQIATSSSAWGGRRSPPMAFTEYGTPSSMPRANAAITPSSSATISAPTASGV